mmetsp:Transcript_5617/g.9235  ORF Transcript_5617/g.9235 Transcript_5617/m.9235 type:complete len:976 (-) Transcript_5617:126-3053(-)
MGCDYSLESEGYETDAGLSYFNPNGSIVSFPHLYKSKVTAFAEWMFVNHHANFLVRKDTEYHLISAGWYAEWKEYANRHTTLQPGPILNNKLVDANTGRLKEKCTLLRDYVIISKDAWEYLFSLYGGGPIIYFTIDSAADVSGWTLDGLDGEVDIPNEVTVVQPAIPGAYSMVLHPLSKITQLADPLKELGFEVAVSARNLQLMERFQILPGEHAESAALPLKSEEELEKYQRMQDVKERLRKSLLDHSKLVRTMRPTVFLVTIQNVQVKGLGPKAPLPNHIYDKHGHLHMYAYVQGEWAVEDAYKKSTRERVQDDEEQTGILGSSDTSASDWPVYHVAGASASMDVADHTHTQQTSRGVSITSSDVPPEAGAAGAQKPPLIGTVHSPSHDEWHNAQQFDNSTPRSNKGSALDPIVESPDVFSASVTKNRRQSASLTGSELFYAKPSTLSLYKTTKPMTAGGEDKNKHGNWKPESCLVTNVSCADNVVLTFMNNKNAAIDKDLFLGQIDIHLGDYPKLLYGERVELDDIPFGRFAVPVGNAQQKRLVTSGNQIQNLGQVTASVTIQALDEKNNKTGWLPKKQFSVFTSSFVNYYFVVTDSKIQYFTNAHSLESPKGSILKADVKSITCCKLGTHDSVFDDVIEALAHSEQGVTAMMPTTGVEVKITTDRETWHLQLLHSDSDSGAGGGSSGDGSSSRDRMSVAESRQWMHALYAHCPQLDKQHGLTSHAEVTSTATPYKHNNAGRDGAAAAAAATTTTSSASLLSMAVELAAVCRALNINLASTKHLVICAQGILLSVSSSARHNPNLNLNPSQQQQQQQQQQRRRVRKASHTGPVTDTLITEAYQRLLLLRLLQHLGQLPENTWLDEGKHKISYSELIETILLLVKEALDHFPDNEPMMFDSQKSHTRTVEFLHKFHTQWGRPDTCLSLFDKILAIDHPRAAELVAYLRLRGGPTGALQKLPSPLPCIAEQQKS